MIRGDTILKSGKLFFALLWLCIFATSFASADTDVAFSYQGRVKVEGQPFGGSGQFKFAIVSTSGTETLWSNDGTGANGNEPAGSLALPVEDGIFNVMIGDTTAGMQPISPTIFASKTPVKLRVWFNDGSRGFQQLNPDQTLVNLALTTIVTGDEDFTVYVNGSTGNDRNNGLKPATAKKTIQAAIDSLPERLRCNVTVEIADGVYRESVSMAGFTAMPKKKLRIIGDNTWTPSQGGSPAVILNGYLAGESGTRSLSHGIFAVGCSNVEIEGLKVVGYQEDGILTENGTYTLKNCVMNSCGRQGYLGQKNCYAELVNCSADLNLQRGLCLSDLSKATLTSCSATRNGEVGLALYKECAVELFQAGTFDSNGSKQIELGGCKIAAMDPIQVKNSRPNATWGIFNSYDSITFSYEKFVFSGNLSPQFQNYIGGKAFYVNGNPAP